MEYWEVILVLLVLIGWLITTRHKNLQYGEEKQYILRTHGYNELY